MNLCDSPLVEVCFKPQPRGDDESGIARALIVFTLSDQDAINSAAGRCRDPIVFHRFLLLLQEVLGLSNGVLCDLSTLGKPRARHDRVESRLVVVGLSGCQPHFGVNKFQLRSAAASFEPAVHLDLFFGALHYVSETLDCDPVSFGPLALQRINPTCFHALLFPTPPAHTSSVYAPS